MKTMQETVDSLDPPSHPDQALARKADMVCDLVVDQIMPRQLLACMVFSQAVWSGAVGKFLGGHDEKN